MSIAEIALSAFCAFMAGVVVGMFLERWIDKGLKP